MAGNWAAKATRTAIFGNHKHLIINESWVFLTHPVSGQARVLAWPPKGTGGCASPRYEATFFHF